MYHLKNHIQETLDPKCLFGMHLHSNVDVTIKSQRKFCSYNKKQKKLSTSTQYESQFLNVHI